MPQLDRALSDVLALERLAQSESPAQRLDARAKVLVTALFLLTVVSFPKYDVSGLLPLTLYPALMLAQSRVPVRVTLRYLLIAAPFAVLIGIFNPLLDNHIVVYWGNWTVTGGWLSFLSILIRFVLTVSAALALLASTGFPALCNALKRLGLPRVLVTQFLLLYRFLFIIPEEAQRMVRAYVLRSRRAGGMPIRVWGSLTGLLLLRAYDRGLRVHTAMRARGFDGTMALSRLHRWTWLDTCFTLLAAGLFLVARLTNPTELIGALLLRGVR